MARDHAQVTGRREESKRQHVANGPGPVPLYARVKQLVVDRIGSGEWATHARIPSENEFLRDLGVSRMTVNRALRELATEGILVRVHGVGTFVAEPKGHTALLEVQNIADEIHARGHRYAARVVLAEKKAASLEIATALELNNRDWVFHTTIVHLENDVPVQLEDRFVNPAVAPAYLEQDFEKMTPNGYLTRVAPLSDAQHIVEAVLAAAWECRLLKMPRSEPCLSIRRLTWSGGKVASLARLLYPGGRYRLEGSRTKQAAKAPEA